MGDLTQTMSLDPTDRFWNGTFSLTSYAEWALFIINAFTIRKQLTASKIVWVESEPGTVEIVLAQLKALKFIFRYHYVNVLTKDALP